MEYPSSPVEHRGARTLAAYESLLKYEPKIIASFVPKNGDEQKAAFLNDEIVTPNHEYDKLDAYDFDGTALAIEQAGAALLDSLDDTNKHRALYEDVVANHLQKLRMLKSAHELKHATTEEDKRQAGERYMADNSELYGAPDEATYRSLLQEEVAAIDAKTVGERAESIRTELHDLLPETVQFEKVERFKPSDETVEWMHIAAVGLYSGMLAHIPEQKTFMPDEVRNIFSEIITDEFGEAASGWQVTIERAQSIVVKTAEKKIVIPIDRGEISHKQVRKLVAHEIGVHVLSSVMGEGTNLEPLRTGLNNYLDAEEALAKVMEQAIDGEFAEAGVDHYITAGLAGIDAKKFRETFEIKWRLAALKSLKGGQDITDEAIEKARDAAYQQVMRSFRGTDEQPWFKDISYHYVVDMWKYLESIQGDDLQFTYVLLGKANPADPVHRRALYEVQDR